MTEEKLVARRQELANVQEQLVAQVNATRGAISECDYWLQELQKPEPEEASDSDE